MARKDKNADREQTQHDPDAEAQARGDRSDDTLEHDTIANDTADAEDRANPADPHNEPVNGNEADAADTGDYEGRRPVAGEQEP